MNQLVPTRRDQPHSPCVCVLGSSSAGNATLIRHGSSAFLVDCGFPPRYIERQLAHHDVTISNLTGIFLTHTHSDHVNPWFVRKAIEQEIPIYCPTDIELHLQAAYEIMTEASQLQLLKPLINDQHEIHDCLIETFPVPHDSPGGCFGYSFICERDGKTKKLTVATDIAFPTPENIRGFVDSDIIVIESNHDSAMLERSLRPMWLKKRIRECGHLSNTQCAEIIRRVMDHSTIIPRSITLAHISQECNTGKLALESAENALLESGISGIELHQTHPTSSSKLTYC